MPALQHPLTDSWYRLRGAGRMSEKFSDHPQACGQLRQKLVSMIDSDSQAIGPVHLTSSYSFERRFLPAPGVNARS